MEALFFGLGGYAKAGKDALADALVEYEDFNKQFMSAALRQSLITLNPWVTQRQEFVAAQRYAEHERIAGSYEASKENPEVRRLLQVMGTEVGRQMFGEDVWVDWLRQKVFELREAGTSVVVTGIRYKNELDWVREELGMTVWVERPGIEPVNEHSSDNTLGPEDFDITVMNDGSLSDLADAGSKLVRDVRWSG
jgi:hypothetical protein